MTTRGVAETEPNEYKGGQMTIGHDTDARLVVDPDCAFCMAAVDWMRGRFRRMVAVTPYPELDLAQYGLTEQQCQDKAWIIGADGQLFGGHLGFAWMLARENRIYRLLGWVLRTPPTSWLASRAYTWIAAHRQLMPGGTDQCRVPYHDPSVSE